MLTVHIVRLQMERNGKEGFDKIDVWVLKKREGMCKVKD